MSNKIKIFIPEIEFKKEFNNETNTYTTDKLNRKAQIEVLVNLISSLKNESRVISIHGKWGTGKSFFVKMLQEELNSENENNIECIYIDAFENDYLEDPTIPLSIAIDSIAGELSTSFIKAARNVTKIYCSATLKLVFNSILNRFGVDSNNLNIMDIFDSYSVTG